MEICYNRVWGTVCDYGWDQADANVVCQQLGFNYQRALPTNNSHFGDGEGPVLLENVRCNQIHSNLSQCVDFQYIGTIRRCMHTAGVICEGMTRISTKQVSIATVYIITANMSRDSTYIDTASNSSVVAILGAVGALIIMIAIAVVTFVLIARLRLKFKVNR